MRIPRFVRAAVVAVATTVTLGAPTASAGDIEIRRDGSKAVDVPAVVAEPTSSTQGDGFDLDDAGLGGASVAALVLAAVAADAARRRHQGRRAPQPAGRAESDQR